MPDSSIMLELCEALKISVNDLLSGEVVTMEQNQRDMEKKLIELMKQKEESDRQLLRLEIVIGVLSTIVLLVPIFLGAFLPMEVWQRVLVICSGIIPGFVGFFFAVKIEQVAGYYECKHCKHRYVPTYWDVTMAQHMGRTRRMQCPNCGKRSWQKKVIGKE